MSATLPLTARPAIQQFISSGDSRCSISESLSLMTFGLSQTEQNRWKNTENWKNQIGSLLAPKTDDELTELYKRVKPLIDTIDVNRHRFEILSSLILLPNEQQQRVINVARASLDARYPRGEETLYAIDVVKCLHPQRLEKINKVAILFFGLNPELGHAERMLTLLGIREKNLNELGEISHLLLEDKDVKLPKLVVNYQEALLPVSSYQVNPNSLP